MCQTTRFHEHLAYRDILKRLPCSWYAWSYSAALSICRDTPYLFRNNLVWTSDEGRDILQPRTRYHRGTENKFVVIFIGDFIWTTKLYVSIDIFTYIRTGYIYQVDILCQCVLRVLSNAYGAGSLTLNQGDHLGFCGSLHGEDRYAAWTLGSSRLKALKRNIES